MLRQHQWAAHMKNWADIFNWRRNLLRNYNRKVGEAFQAVKKKMLSVGEKAPLAFFVLYTSISYRAGVDVDYIHTQKKNLKDWKKAK